MAEALRVEIGDSWRPKALVYFAMVMMALMLITNILNLKFVNFFGLAIIASQISYVLSLIVADIMAEVYGYRRVRRLLWVGLGCLILFAGFVQLAVFLPPATGTSDEAFRALLASTPRLVAASILAYFVTELTNSFIMSRLKIVFNARRFYLRALAAVAGAQIVNGAVFYIAAYGGKMPVLTIVSAASFSWAAVMICEIIVLPFTKRLAVLVKRHEGVEHFDSAPAA